MIAGRTALILALGAATATPPAAYAASFAKHIAGSIRPHSEQSAPEQQPSRLHRVYTARASGEFPSVTLSGFVPSPSRALISVAATPAQQVTVNWAAICPHSPTTHGQFAAVAPFKRNLGVTARTPGPCSIGLRVAPTTAGAVVVTLED